MTASTTTDHAMLVLALELKPGTQPSHAALGAESAGRLIELVGRDLARFVPQVAALDLVLAAAHFDPAEALRPGWPLHRRLEELLQRAPRHGGEPRLIAFGADGEGRVPLPFQCQADLAGGALRVLPLLLSGPADTVQAVADALEAVLLEQGMANADTALALQQAFGAEIEHVRYLTRFDLAALMAMQYEHQHLQALWPLIETALLAPASEQWLDAPPEPLLRYADGEARIALLGANAWRKRHGDALGNDVQRLNQAYDYFQARQRQLAAVLEAHGIPVTYVYCDEDCDPAEALRQA